MKLKDQIGRQLNFRSVPKRIVSLVPSQTELLCDLGLEDTIVGVTKFCVHPNHILKTKAIVGGTKQINIEKIKALQPDVILCNKEENTLEIVSACEAICPVHVSDIISIADCLELFHQYGELFEKEDEALILVNALQTNYKTFLDYIKDKPKCNVAYFIWKEPWMVAGNNTFINTILEINQFHNVFENNSRYPEVNINNLPKNLDVILLSSEPFPFKENHVNSLRQLYPKTKIVIVDGEYFSWYGSRLIKAFDYLKLLRERML